MLAWKGRPHSQPGVAEAARPGLDLGLQGQDVGVALEAGLEVLQLLPLLGLDLHRDLAAPVEEPRDLLEVVERAPPRRHRRGPDAHAARRQGGDVAGHRVAVQRDGHPLADLLQLGPGQAVRAHVPQDEVVVGPVAGELVPLLLQGVRQRLRARHDHLGVLHESGGLHLEELCCQPTNLVVVGSALQPGKHGHIDPLFDVRDRIRVFEEDHPSTWPTQ
mmetsp:Transcript_123039/g.348740  ORF Transcript_123039/g.348740 Transcript_123039/m.348740 type:complete len:218 (+) Transcript_123039:126-779(+)